MNLFLQYAVDAISLGGLYALIALGIGLIFGVLGLVNFAHGELITITAYALLMSLQLPWPLACAVALASTIAAAYGMNKLAFAPVRESDPSTLMIASFAVSFTLQNLAIIIFGARAKTLNFLPTLTDETSLLGLRISIATIAEIAVTLALTLLLSLYINYTALGRQMRAVAERPQMARLVGINAPFVVSATFVISAILAAAAGILIIVRTGTVSPAMGVQFAIVGFMATVIGGIGSLVGCALGGFLVGFVTAMLQLGLPTDLQPFREAFLFAAVIGFLVVAPGGIVGGRYRQERI